MNAAVIVLAGGRGSRIGGRKPLRMLGGKSLIDRAEALARQWSAIVAVAVREPEQIGPGEIRRIRDVAGIDGPLAGLVAGLHFAADAGCAAALTIPADMPFVPADLNQRLAAEIGSAGAAIARSGGRLHPVCGLWRLSALDVLADYVAGGGRSLKGFAAAAGFRAVDWPAQPADPFFNINSEEELAAAEQMLRR